MLTDFHGSEIELLALGFRRVSKHMLHLRLAIEASRSGTRGVGVE